MKKSPPRKKATKREMITRRKKIRKEAQAETPEPVVFDADSYPIWVSPTVCAPFPDLYCFGHDFRTTKQEGNDVRVNVGLILSSKLLIHGVGIFYQTPNPGTYISRIELEAFKFNEETGMLSPVPAHQRYESGDIQLSSTSLKEYRFLVGKPGGTPVRGRVNLYIRLHLEQAHLGIYLAGIRIMVKDL